MSKLKPSANVDGQITDLDVARIPVMDRGFLYGDSVYEVFRTYRGVPLFMEEHFERLENSARLISMSITQSRDELVDEIRRTVAAAGATEDDDVYVRYQITRGEGAVDLYPDPDLQTRYVVIVKPLPRWNPEFYEVGMAMAVPHVRRNPVNALDPNIKGGNYLNNILALTEARQRGADDCVILNREGFVTEAANSNVWFVIGGELRTPGSGNLRGLTKRHVHRALKEAGLDSREDDIHVNELLDATECFVTSATREVMPVKSLLLEDDVLLNFTPGGGPVTVRASELFRAYISRYIDAHRDESLVGVRS